MLVNTFCAALKRLFPCTRRRKWRDADGKERVEEETYSEKIDLVNERLSQLAIEGRWEAFNIPCHGHYLPDHPNVEARVPSHIAPVSDVPRNRVSAP
jgi:cytochrome c-type biogenesis protein CcmH/NrfG